MSRRTGPDQATAQLVVTRNLGMCLRCNLRPGSQIHHRCPRQMGGTRDPQINEAPNLVWICAGCHADIESHREKSYEDGWLIRRTWLHISDDIDLVDLQGREFTLGRDGGIHYIAPSEVANP